MVNKLNGKIFLFIVIMFIGLTLINNSANSQDNSMKFENVMINKNHITMSVFAKSTLLDNNSTERYSIKNLFDNNYDNVWATRLKPSENIDRDFFITFKNSQTIKSISINNGFIKNDSLFNNNARVKTIVFYFYEDDGKNIYEGNGKDHYVYQKEVNLRDTPESQEIIFGEIAFNKIKRIEIDIKEVYKGNKYEDICISNFEINLLSIRTNNFKIGDYYLIDDYLINEVSNWNGYNILYSGIAIFKNNSTDDILLIRSVCAMYKAEIWHFSKNNIPSELIKEAEDFTKSNKKNIDVIPTIKNAIENAKIIDKGFFESNLGMKLGNTIEQVIKLYGQPDKIEKQQNEQKYSWEFYGLEDHNITNVKLHKDRIITNTILSRYLNIYFRDDKAIALKISNQCP